MNKEQTLDAQVNTTKLILDTANSFCTKENIMAMESARSMPEHQINLIRQMILGQFSKTPVKKIDQKVVTAGIVAFMSLSPDQVQKLGEELDKARAEAAQKKDQGDVNVGLIVPTRLSGLKQVFGFLPITARLAIVAGSQTSPRALFPSHLRVSHLCSTLCIALT